VSALTTGVQLGTWEYKVGAGGVGMGIVSSCVCTFFFLLLFAEVLLSGLLLLLLLLLFPSLSLPPVF
jgi:hypothetical protein